MQPMTAFAKRLLSEMSDYSVSEENLTVNGEIYSLPYEVRTVVLYYRKDIFGSGFEDAKTVYDILDVCKSYVDSHSRENVSVYQIPLSTAQNAGGLIQVFCQLVSCAGGTPVEDGKYVFNDEAGVKAVEYLKMFFDQGVCNQSELTTSTDDELSNFQAGTAYTGGSFGAHRYSAATNSEYKDDIGIVFYPPFVEGEPAPVIAPAKTLAIGNYAQNVEGAEDFIAYSLSVDSQKNWVGSGLLPARNEVFELEEIKSRPDYDLISMFHQSSSTAKIIIHPANFTEMSVAFAETLQNIVFNGADIQQSLDELVNRFNS